MQTNLDWTAFCYIADELSDAEREQFELQLATDQNARDAVASAMQQAQQLWLALDATQLQTSSRRQSSPHATPPIQTLASTTRTPATLFVARPSVRRYPATLLAVAAALLLMTVGWSWLARTNSPNNSMTTLANRGQPQPASRSNDMPHTSGEQLALAWAATLDDSAPEITEINADSDDWLVSDTDWGASDADDNRNPAFTNTVFEDTSWMLDALEESSDRDSLPPGDAY